MRWLALAVLGACSFSPGQLRGDAAGSSDDARIDAPVDAAIDTMIDVAIDTPPPNPAKVRSLEIVDAQVISGPHTDFPMLVSLTTAWLATTANGGDVATGTDIYFSADQGGAQRLAHDVEVYTPTGTLVAWVKVPSLATTSVIYLHYGDPAITTSQQNVAATWVGYALVAHMDGSGDATGQASQNQGTNVGAVATGRIGAASSFNGTDSVQQFGSDTELDNLFTNGATVEGWVFLDTFGEGSRARIFDKGEDAGWALLVDNFNATSTVTFIHGWSTSHGYWPAASNSINTGNWHHVALTYDKASTAQNPSMIINGVTVTVNENDTPSGSAADDSNQTLSLGNNSAGTRAFDGNLDEMRLSTAPRSAGWLQTQYRNQSDPANFYTVSAPL